MFCFRTYPPKTQKFILIFLNNVLFWFCYLRFLEGDIISIFMKIERREGDRKDAEVIVFIWAKDGQIRSENVDANQKYEFGF